MARKKQTSSELDISGVWFNPEKSGWGVFIQPIGTEFHSCAVFTYDEKGNQLWIVGSTQRGDLTFKLISPKGLGAFDNIRDKQDREAGVIEFDLVEPGKISYKATINSEVVMPPPGFSPKPPPTITFEGVLTRMG